MSKKLDYCKLHEGVVIDPTWIYCPFCSKVIDPKIIDKVAKEYEKEVYGGVCWDCGKERFPKYDPSKLQGITAHEGTCPICKKEKVGLVPLVDWLYASGESDVWD